MLKKGIDLRFNSIVTCVTKQQNGALMVDLQDAESLEADLVMYATGRHPNTADLGLEAAGVGLDEHGFIVVDGDRRTSVENIYAIGDCTTTIHLTPVAIAEGHALADRLFNPSGRKVRYENVPSAVFSQPSLATVGLSEADARERGIAIDVYKSAFRPMKHTLSGRDERTVMKLVAERASGRVIGAHMIGPEAGEIIQGLAIAMTAGATKADFDATIGIHPTAAEEFVTMRQPEPDPEEEMAAAE